MRGFTVAQEGHVVHALPPINATSGASCDRFTMKNYSHATIIVMLGVTTLAPTSIIVNSCTAATAGTATAIGFDYYAELTAAGDTLGAKTTVAATGITTVTANDNTMYIIELDDSQLLDGAPFVEVVLDIVSATSVLAAVVVVLSGARYGADQSVTALA